MKKGEGWGSVYLNIVHEAKFFSEIAVFYAVEKEIRGGRIYKSNAPSVPTHLNECYILFYFQWCCLLSTLSLLCCIHILHTFICVHNSENDNNVHYKGKQPTNTGLVLHSGVPLLWATTTWWELVCIATFSLVIIKQRRYQTCLITEWS